jgi:hypothetical protein
MSQINRETKRSKQQCAKQGERSQEKQSHPKPRCSRMMRKIKVVIKCQVLEAHTAF